MNSAVQFVIYTGFCLVGGVLLLLGGAIIGSLLHTVWKGLRSRRWSMTIGQIISNEGATVETEQMPQRGAPDAVVFQTGVTYEYEVDGKRRTADALQVKGSLTTGRSTRYEEQLAGRYRPGDSVTVYYSPTDPDDVALHPGVPRGLFPIAVPGAVLFLVGLLMILLPTGVLKVLWRPWTLGAVFMLPGVALFLFGLRSLWMAFFSRSWPTTEATVMHSTVTRASRHDMYQPSVAYRYEVNGVHYIAATMDWGRFGQPRDDAQMIADQYPVGETATIHYHPTRPERAVIEPRGGWAYFTVALIGAGLAVSGAILTFHGGGG